MNKTEMVNKLVKLYGEYGLTEALHRMFEKNIKVNIGFSKASRAADIDELMLSVRSYNGLKRANISTVGDLIERLENGGLANIRNLGEKSLREIKTRLLLYGFMQLSEKEKSTFFSDVVKNNVA